MAGSGISLSVPSITSNGLRTDEHLIVFLEENCGMHSLKIILPPCLLHICFELLGFILIVLSKKIVPIYLPRRAL